MSKATSLKLHRKFEQLKGGEIIRRDKPLSPVQPKIVDCFNCGKPVLMHYKQIVMFHKGCRKEGRAKLKKYLKAQGK